MANILRRTALAVLLTGAASPASAQQGAKPKDPAAERLTGAEWLAQDIKGGGVVDTTQSTVRIDTDGSVRGAAGCNRLTGRATVNGVALTFSPLATSRMACPPAVMDQERKFLFALVTTQSYRFDGDVLKFLDSSGAELIRFTQLR